MKKVLLIVCACLFLTTCQKEEQCWTCTHYKIFYVGSEIIQEIEFCGISAEEAAVIEANNTDLSGIVGTGVKMECEPN